MADLISLREFASLVREMRAMQKSYFQQRDTKSLVAAKQLEKRVDDKIAAIEAFEPEGPDYWNRT